MNAKIYATPLVITLQSGGITLAYSQSNKISLDGIKSALTKVSFIPESISHKQQVYATPAATSYLYVIKTSHSDRIGSEPNKQSIIPSIARSVQDPLIVKSVDPPGSKLSARVKQNQLPYMTALTGNARNRVIELEVGTL
ncbi:MAG: hypothetical protein U1B83_01990 [Candidatus Cloacimonadaceae bacterium]|nr:hypothetical protein [Candidatus Cloacimonadaceae bacterium]